MPTSYTSIKIDGVDVIVDPDTMSVATQNLIQVKKSMGGTDYITNYNHNTAGFLRTVNIGGLYLPEATATILLGKSAKKSTLVVAGGIVGTGGTFIITSMQIEPLKPMVPFPGDDTIKYRYSVSLQEVG